jgi:MFS family permease
MPGWLGTALAVALLLGTIVMGRAADRFASSSKPWN